MAVAGTTNKAAYARWYMPLVAESAVEIGFMIVLTGGTMPVGIDIRYEILSIHEGNDVEKSRSCSRTIQRNWLHPSVQSALSRYIDALFARRARH
jgi:hypothetical protein